MKARVFIPEPIGSEGLDLLSESCDCLAPWREPADVEADPGANLRAADAIIVRIFRMGIVEIDSAPDLRVIAKHGVGLDNIDVSAATIRRIPVVFTPGSNANAVAEHTLAMMLALTRRLVPADRAVRDGWVVERTQFQGVELQGRTLGIVGLGRIGKRVALKAAVGLGMRVVAHDPYVDRSDYPGPAILVDSLEEVLRSADFLTLHVPLTEETRYMIRVDTLKMVPANCRLINTSRGAVVDDAALVEALSRGSIAGAAIDVFETEPLPGDHPMLKAPNLLLTPHIAGQSSAAMQASSLAASRAVLDVLAGRRPVHLVNPEIYD